MKPKLIDTEWQAIQKIFPADVSAVQVRESRRMFYAGVISALGIIRQAAQSGPAGIAQTHRDLCDELNQYLAQLKMESDLSKNNN